ncbi:MAG: hypothetical protein ACAI35_27825 [Candidatus Methylacidiphilales bacterium]|nr:hypothetical protein [Candidatus Methylacidiphilales bacterium]
MMLAVACLGMAGCASPNSSEREARAGDSDLRQDVYRSQIEGFEYRAVVTEDDLRVAWQTAGTSPINSTDAERRARNYLAAAYPLRQSLVVQSVIQMPLRGTELPPEADPDHKGTPMTYFIVSLRSTHKPRYPQDVDMVKMIVYPNGQIVPFRAKGRWIS